MTFPLKFVFYRHHVFTTMLHILHTSSIVVDEKSRFVVFHPIFGYDIKSGSRPSNQPKSAAGKTYPGYGFLTVSVRHAGINTWVLDEKSRFVVFRPIFWYDIKSGSRPSNQPKLAADEAYPGYGFLTVSVHHAGICTGRRKKTICIFFIRSLGIQA